MAMFLSASGLGSDGDRESITMDMIFFWIVFSSAENLNHIAIAFRHLLPVQTGHNGDFLADLGSGTTKVSPYCSLNLIAISRVISRCCF